MEPTTSNDDRTHAAYHEAGHAVAARVLMDAMLKVVELFITSGSPSSGAGVSNDGSWCGFCLVAPVGGVPEKPSERFEQTRQVMIQVASGGAAERRAGGHPSKLNLQCDEQQLRDAAALAFSPRADEHTCALLVSEACARADELMGEVWETVEALAMKLLDTPYCLRTVTAEGWPEQCYHYLDGDEVEGWLSHRLHAWSPPSASRPSPLAPQP